MEVRFLAHQRLPDAFAAVRFEPSRDGEYYAEATVQSRGFLAHLAQVYFFRRDVERFTAELRRALAGFGSEDIELKSASPGVCVLRVRRLSPDGEGDIEASLGRLHMATGEWAWDRTTVVFPLTTVGWDEVLADLNAVLGMTSPDDTSA